MCATFIDNEKLLTLIWVGGNFKLDKRNKTMLKKIDDDIILANCDVIVIFSIFD